MKKKLLLCLSLAIGSLTSINAQSKSTGNLSLVTGITANLTLNNTTSMATLVLSGPNDRWFAFKFGSFVHPMQLGVDGVYWNGTTLIDGNEGEFAGLFTDAIQNWTVSSSTLSGTVRTITATRPFVTGDANDYTFVYSNTTIDISVAKGANANYTMSANNKHCSSCRTVNYAVPFTTLGVEDFSLKSASVFPNPTKGDFSVQAKTSLTKINIYTQTGVFVKTINVDNSSSDNVEVNVKGIETGIYLIELVNDSEKSWKKVIVN